MWAALREKVPNVLSRCHARPSFDMAPTFQKNSKKSVSYQKI